MICCAGAPIWCSARRRVWQSAETVAAGIPSRKYKIKNADEADLAKWFAHPLVGMHASQDLKRIELYSQQLAELETTILALAKQEQSYELLQKLILSLFLQHMKGKPDFTKDTGVSQLN